MSRKVRIAVVSDVHAYDSRDNPKGNLVSFLDIAKSEGEHRSHPISALLRLIQDSDLKADLLISPGDFSDKAAPVALRYVWDKVHALGSSLGVKMLIPTAGNHDLDSRYQHSDFDAKGMLQALVPTFPFADEIVSNKFWARNYTLIHHERLRILVLNSAAFHGTGPDEIEHGRVSKATLSTIETELSNDTSEYDANILLCHHHPVKYNDLSEDNSVMKGGDVLMELLNRGEFGSWIVIHGHKHSPNLFYAAGGGGSAIIFSAGSLSAVLYPELQTKARNQFHILELDLDATDTLGLGLVGTVYSWDWNEGLGWQQAGLRSGLPHVSNFGNRESAKDLAREMIAELKKTKEPFLRWEELITALPKHKYILPKDLQTVARMLEKQNVSVSWESNSCVIAELGRKP